MNYGCTPDECMRNTLDCIKDGDYDRYDYYRTNGECKQQAMINMNFGNKVQHIKLMRIHILIE